MPDDELVELVITAPDEAWLIAFTRRLVDERLAACGHHTSIRSVYTWNSELHDEIEIRVALHTRASLFDRVGALVAAEHPYKVACVVSTPIWAASPAYRDWVLNSTG